MADKELHEDLIPVANEWLRRYQVPTDRTTDRISMGLLNVFIKLIAPNLEKLSGLEKLPLDDGNEILTVELTDIGVKLGRHPSREIERAKKIFEIICSNPYVTFTIKDKGIKEYHTIPLLKYGMVTPDGKCKLIFNDQLIRFFFPEKDYSLCSLNLFDEIRKRNVYSAIIFEEAYSYLNMCRNGNEPYFKWSIKETREKFGFNKMMVSSDDNTKYVSSEIKSMRIDNLISKVFFPAIAVLKEIFTEGKINFWVKLEIRGLKKGKAGRPPKDYFHFILKKTVPTEHTGKDGERLEMFDYEEMDTLYYIREELRKILYSKKMVNNIVEQLKNNEQLGSHEEVLATIKAKLSQYAVKPKNAKANIILSILGKEHHLGDPLKFGETPKEDKEFWPDSLEERIKVMMDSPEIKDKAAKEFCLTSDEVNILLEGDFQKICIKNDKLKKDWSDACNYFFNWIKKLGIHGPLNTEYNEQKTTKNKESSVSSFGRTAKFFLKRAADKKGV